ncbi:MAG TPA: hypothetical protein P5550_05595, partial [Bacteroidales bacterium]|nr:hypothetical protein [Bacteroidales bacterium]
MSLYRREILPQGLLLPLSLVSTLLLLLTFFSAMRPEAFWWLFSSDALYLPAMYRDWFIDGRGIQGWHFNPSPNFLPDMPVYFILMWITGGNIIASTSLYGILQYAAIILLFHQIVMRYSDTRTARRITALGNLLLALLLISPIREGFLFLGFYLLINAYHSSVLLFGMAGFLLFQDFVLRGGFWRLGILFLMTLLAVVSDQINLVTVVFPIAGTSALSFRLPFPRRRMLMAGAAALLAGSGGLWAFRELNTLTTIHFDLPHKIFLYEEMWIAGRRMLVDLYEVINDANLDSVLVLGALSALLLTFAAALRSVFRGKGSEIWALYWIFAAFFSAGVLAAPVINGNYSSFDCLRYNIYPLYLGLLNLPFLLHRRRWFRGNPGQFAFAGLLGLVL